MLRKTGVPITTFPGRPQGDRGGPVAYGGARRTLAVSGRLASETSRRAGIFSG